MTARPFTILLVSSDRTTLRRLSKFLEVFGYDVRQATAGPQALAAAEAARPDFFIVDASTGDEIDLQLCRQVRRIWSQGYTFSLLLAEQPEVADITAALESGFDDFLTAPIVFGELLARLRTGARVIEFERRLSEQAGIEQVTGLADKASLAVQLQLQSQNAKGPVGWLALFDLDYFFRISDRFGRQPAQTLLRQAMQLLQQQCGEGSFAASLGDDRLAVLRPVESNESAIIWAQNTLAALSEATFEVAGNEVKLTASCGLTEAISGEAFEVVLARAQQSLQLAKASGRSCVSTAEEVASDAEQWAAFAADGKLFQTTVARDVMSPCPLLLNLDEGIDQAHALLQLTGLTTAPVVDNEGKLAGIVTVDQLSVVRPKPSSPPSNNAGNNKSRGSSSVRLVRHVMSSDVARFEEGTPLGNLMEFFTGDSSPLAVVVRDKRPRGLVHCQGLAALNDRLTADHFTAVKLRTNTSEDLLVPDLAIAE